jgi:hypothetical protein
MTNAIKALLQRQSGFLQLESIFMFKCLVLLRAKKVGHQISVSFEKFDVVQALLSFFLTLFQLTV